MSVAATLRDASLPTPVTGPPPVLRAMGLSKSFGVTRALDSCSLVLRPGEVHAVVGENGSGKSTLVKILAGIQRPTGGSLDIGGRRLRGLSSPRSALAAGIATVFQEPLAVGSRSVLENVWLGADGLFRSARPLAGKAARAEIALGDLLATPPRLRTPVELLTLAERQACCIARALVREPSTLVLDEATSALDIATTARLFALLERLTADGVAVLFISHRLDEIEHIADRITVLRAGTSVATVERGEFSAAELVAAMSGRPRRSRRPRSMTRPVPGEPVLRTRGLSLRRGARPTDFTLRAGELVGLAGLEGHGQTAFLRALAGHGAVGGEVSRETPGGSAPVRSPRQALTRGIAYVPRDRRADGVFGALSIRENFAVPTLRRDRRGPFLDGRRTERRLAGYAAELRIRLASSRDPIGTLSGGNQQKLVIARWLATAPRILLLDDPTRGVDAASKQDVYRLLTHLAADGVSVVMLSTEVDEHVELMDRVLVFREQALFAELPRRTLSRGTLVGAFFGQRRPEPDA